MKEYTRDDAFDAIRFIQGPITSSMMIHFSQCDEEDSFDYMMIVDQNGDKRDVIKYVDRGCGSMPDKVVFNKNNTIVCSDDERYVIKCGKEDTFNPVFGFLYGYFLMNSGMTKTEASKFFESFYDIKGEQVVTIKNSVDKQVEDILSKNLTLDEYVDEMKKISKK